MKKTIQLLLIIVVFSSTRAFACYNEFQSLNSSGKFHIVDEYELDFYTNFDNSVIKTKLSKLGKQLKNNPSLEVLSDYALYLVRGGKTKEALFIFEKLAEKFPEEYVVIANLGTTYELSGNDEKALEYIRKGLQLNPKSHNGSEWIHVKLLELKIAQKKNPNLLQGKSLLQLTTKQKSDNKVRLQILDQLKERFRFCAPPDEIMAALLIDLGDCYKEQLSFEHAKAIYEVAKKYYKSTNSLLDGRIEECRRLREQNHNVKPTVAIEYVQHGMIEKVGGVPYTNLLMTNDNSKQVIHWSDYETDPQTLLSYVIVSTGSTEQNSVKISNKPLPKRSGDAEGSFFSTFNVLIGLNVLVLLFIIGLFIRSRRRN